ncbi:hypothetical protein B0H16DRAFT_1483490 [Mycena metata]|uniref:Uncharacterized protein n=1 Tax=Mycena metata TaxID=1033252 RepID=A0AAD7DXG2_9AGAR|nr:hypothetical protein B0H16DRAFT_1483490 [Mycena metata]
MVCTGLPRLLTAEEVEHLSSSLRILQLKVDKLRAEKLRNSLSWHATVGEFLGGRSVSLFRCIKELNDGYQVVVDLAFSERNKNYSDEVAKSPVNDIVSECSRDDDGVPRSLSRIIKGGYDSQGQTQKLMRLDDDGGLNSTMLNGVAYLRSTWATLYAPTIHWLSAIISHHWKLQETHRLSGYVPKWKGAVTASATEVELRRRLHLTVMGSYKKRTATAFGDTSQNGRVL